MKSSNARSSPANPSQVRLRNGYIPSISRGAFQDDSWYAKDVPLGGCYFAHTDFRLHPVPKNQRFVDFLPAQRKEIDSGTCPCSFEIRAPWSGPMPEPLAQERGPDRYYILGWPTAGNSTLVSQGADNETVRVSRFEGRPRPPLKHSPLPLATWHFPLPCGRRAILVTHHEPPRH
jgi:hypothetical protein